jgi:hypothetical protein
MQKGQPLIDPNLSTDDKVKKIEKLITHLARRSKKTKTAMVTPFPISSASFGDNITGPIIRYMFPCEGRITKAMVEFGAKPKKPVTVEVDLRNNDDGESRIYFIDRRTTIVAPMIEVLGGDRLTVSVFPKDDSEEAKVTECWIALLWTPDVSEVDIKNVLIEDLEESLDA